MDNKTAPYVRRVGTRDVAGGRGWISASGVMWIMIALGWVAVLYW